MHGEVNGPAVPRPDVASAGGARPGGAGMSGYAPIRDQFLRFGDLRPQGAGEWRGPFPLPPALAEFYAEVGPLGPVVYEHVGPVGVTIPGTALGFAPLASCGSGRPVIAGTATAASVLRTGPRTGSSSPTSTPIR